MSLAQGIFPDQLICSIIKPIYKNGHKAQILNYRPVSLLMGFSKIMEIVISQRLKQYLGIHNIKLQNNMVSEMEYQPVMPFINLLILFMMHGITNTTLLAFSVT